MQLVLRFCVSSIFMRNHMNSGKITHNKNGNTNYKIINTLGQIIHEGEMVSDFNLASTLQNGNYILQLINPQNNQVITTKLTIIHK